jgi:hypothetical protein
MPVLRCLRNKGPDMKEFLIATAAALILLIGPAFAQNTSDLIQSGDSNSATVEQVTPGSNTSQIYQGTITSGSSGNTVDIGQIGGSGSILSSIVHQDGSGQYAYIRQDGSLGGTISLNIAQSNQNNYVSITQASGGTGASIGYNITQTGQNGVAVVNQTGSSGSYTIVQSGNGDVYTGPNVSPGIAGGPMGGGGAVIGGGPVAGGFFEQAVIATPLGPVTVGVNLTQSGESTNNAPTYQYSDYSGASITQTGDLGGTNTSTINQNSGVYNMATVWQTAASGVTNTSVITQGGAGWNFANINQH